MKRSSLLVAVVATIGASGVVSAATVDVTLTGVNLGNGPGEISAAALGFVLTGSYDIVAGIVTMDSGLTTVRFDIGPTSLFTHIHQGWSTGAGGYSAADYACSEGSFGLTIHASLCGGYNFGANNVIESTHEYSAIPGTRTIGGDDVVVQPQQQGSDYAATTASFTGPGGELVMQSALWNSSGTGGHSTEGIELVFSVAVPVPAASWMFGSAIALLVWMRRRTT